MAFADTGKAIGKVSEHLQDLLPKIILQRSARDFIVTVGRPGKITASGNGRLNLFLYEALFDPSLKNVSLEEGKPAPLWLVLKYIMTAFDDESESDTMKAHEILGEGIRALQEMSLTQLSESLSDAQKDNPELLKITFDEIPADLLSKLMQGPDDKYRFSIGFQVRPIMIVTGELPSYPLLVGVDYTQSPVKEREDKEMGVHIPVLSSFGPEITGLSPMRFEPGDTVTIFGSDLHLAGISTVRLGPSEFTVSAQRPEKLEFIVDDGAIDPAKISAGGHAVCVQQILPDGRRRSSNLLIGELLPVLSEAEVDANSLKPATDPADPVDNSPNVITGDITLTGELMGTAKDDVIVAFYSNGATYGIVEVIKTNDFSPFSDAQDKLSVRIEDKHRIPQGIYRVILRVNGCQARISPEVKLKI